MAMDLSDLLIRRAHLAFGRAIMGRHTASRAADIVAPLLGWDDSTKRMRIREFEQDIARIFTIGDA
jgi:glycerol-3-phosphate dehydrogenase